MKIFAQSPQADSLKFKQELYWKTLKEKEQKAKETAASGHFKAAETVVVTYDSKGNKIERKKEGKITTKTFTVSGPILNRPFNVDTISRDSVYIKVFKSKNRLQVYHKGKILTAYICVFGPNCVGQKMCEGDRKTPEGTFTILDRKKHDKWDTFMLLDYPNEESKRFFEDAKIKGLVAADARIGGAIGIHGIWENGDNVVDMKHNWTDGCVGLKNKDVRELSTIILPGYTKIVIIK
jgi:lipoprotein-anchoring transpeptidase ErfK/SrfK